MGWEAGLAIDVMLLFMFLGVIAIPIGAIYGLVKLVRGKKPPPPGTPLEELRTWAAEREADE